ncbi:MAG: hypothetical protein P0Y53_13985 [Candidatus Pseudobacter hemicellulosilyticus]|uniref:Uncharacterized protein n=1 Tax=Candidatus Pseudobacter hemicellulosilyticus TaxID=3121375 RepID=A0AAJ5WN18_9BACT|nr:MAG: hypothetical protein P0Y53_13985 [Pseudobacter sp.]
MESKEIVLSLIKDELTSARLLNNLNQIGLSATDYYLQLRDTILKLMGFGNDQYADQVYSQYYQLAEEAMEQNNMSFQKNLDQHAQNIYVFLLEKQSK